MNTTISPHHCRRTRTWHATQKGANKPGRLVRARLASCTVGLISLLISLGTLANTVTQLTPDTAFQLSAHTTTNHSIALTFKIKPGFYLYQAHLKVTSPTPATVLIGHLILPPAQIMQTRLGPQAVYGSPTQSTTLSFNIPISLQTPNTPFQLDIHYQGCSNDGYCTPPHQQRLQARWGQTQVTWQAVAASHDQTLPSPPSSTIAWLLKLISLLGLGVLLAFTPCVLPMIPILGALLAQQANPTGKSTFLHTLTYVLSMASTYAVIGLILSGFGQHVALALQTPWVIGLSSLALVVLACALFGLINLKLPSHLQTSLAELSQKQSSKGLIGVAITGCLATLILSPCVTAPLLTVLGWLAMTGQKLWGGLALFSLGLGMGLPLLLFGLLGARVLPKAGPWMQALQTALGLGVLVVSLGLLQRILPGPLSLSLWALWLALCAYFIWPKVAPSQQRTNATPTKRKLRYGLTLLISAYAIALLVSASQGGTRLLAPFSLWLPAAFIQQQRTPDAVVRSQAELSAVLQQARQAKQPVLLDVYADWCSNCRLLEHTLFAQPDIIRLLKNWTFVRLDVTQQNPNTQALAKAWHVVAPPTLIVLDARHQQQSRLVGHVAANEFKALIKQHTNNKPT